MFFLARAAFWLTVVFFLLPAEQRPSLASATDQKAVAAMTRAAAQRVMTACADRPRQCIDQALVAEEFGAKATLVLSRLAGLTGSPRATKPQG